MTNRRLPRPLRIASHPDHNPGNPYIELLYGALARYGIHHAGRLVVSENWLTGAGKDVNVVHIHWPERIWRGKRVGRIDRTLAFTTGRSIRGVRRLCRFLDTAKARGVTRLWTVHNIAHHEGASAIDRWGYRELARRSDMLICFSHAAAQELRWAYGRDTPILVMSHGSYKGAYPPPRAFAESRSELGLRDDMPVVSCLGLLRPYKGIELAYEAIEILNGKVQLLVAGQPHKTFDLPDLLARAAASRGTIVAIPRPLTEAEFSNAVAASDAVVLPYHAVTGSGVLFAAWTLGAGVIASDLPFFREMLSGAPLCGQTFRTGDSADLARSIERYLAIPRTERRDALAAIADELAPEHAVRPLVDFLYSRFHESGEPKHDPELRS